MSEETKWLDRLPNGCSLYYKEHEQGRSYYSDEVGGGVFVWDTALVDISTLLAAITKEYDFQRKESVGKKIKYPAPPDNYIDET